MAKFNEGDKVIKVDGMAFTTGEFVATVRRYDEELDRVHFKHGYWMNSERLRNLTPQPLDMKEVVVALYNDISVVSVDPEHGCIDDTYYSLVQFADEVVSYELEGNRFYKESVWKEYEKRGKGASLAGITGVIRALAEGADVSVTVGGDVTRFNTLAELSKVTEEQLELGTWYAHSN